MRQASNTSASGSTVSSTSITVFPAGSAGLPALQQRHAAEVDEGFLGSDQILQPDHQQAVGQHLSGSNAAFGAVELVLSGVGAKQQLVAVDAAVAVEDGLPGDKGIHAPLSAGRGGRLSSCRIGTRADARASEMTGTIP